MPIDPSIVGRKLDPIPGEWTEKDVMLYALGVGETSLPFCYERDLKVLPTFAVVPPFPAMFTIGGAMNVNPMMILHGEQRIELAGPIPTRAKVTSQPQVVALYDNASGRRIEDAVVRAQLSESGIVDEPAKYLPPMKINDQASYGQVFTVAKDGPYRFKVWVRLAQRQEEIEFAFSAWSPHRAER